MTRRPIDPTRSTPHAAAARTPGKSDEAARDDARGFSDRDLADIRDFPDSTDADLAALQPFAEMFPAQAEAIRRTRGPQKRPIKQPISLRLDRDVIERFKAGGRGWQARMGDALRKASGLG